MLLGEFRKLTEGLSDDFELHVTHIISTGDGPYYDSHHLDGLDIGHSDKIITISTGDVI